MLAGLALAQRLAPLPSLHDPRHRSCTGSRLLAALPSHVALRQRQRVSWCCRKRPGVTELTRSGSCAGPNSAYNIAQLCAIASNCRAAVPHSHNPCYTHNRPRRVAAANGQGLRAAAARLLLRPSAERPAAAALRSSSTGRAFGPWLAASRPAAAALRSSGTGRARQGPPPCAGPRPPAPLPPSGGGKGPALLRSTGPFLAGSRRCY